MATTENPQNGPTVDLPPAGHERDEELARREDDLQQEAEETAAKLEVERMNPEKLKPINEIQQHFNEFNELHVSNADPAYVYCWVNSGSHGLFVKLKMAEKFEVVQGEMEEAREHKGAMADTTRRVGDTILMRIRKDHFQQVLKRRRAAAERHMSAATTGLRDLGEKYRDLGVVVKTVEDGTMDQGTLERMGKRAAAQNIAGDMQTKWLKEGRMPGVPAPGVK